MCKILGLVTLLCILNKMCAPLQNIWKYSKNSMNELIVLYSALLCIAVHPKSITIIWWWCDGCHRTTVPVRSPHTSYRWRGKRVIEPIKCMGIIRRPWLTRASGGNLARTPGLHPYSLRDVSHDFYSVPSLHWGVRTHTDCRVSTPPAGLNNSSSSSNLVFTGGLPSRYWPGSALLSFSGQPVLGCRVIWLPVNSTVNYYYTFKITILIYFMDSLMNWSSKEEHFFVKM